MYYKAHGESVRDIALSPGAKPASEPETQALLDLVRELRPSAIVSLHAPLGCVEDPDQKPLAIVRSALAAARTAATDPKARHVTAARRRLAAEDWDRADNLLAAIEAARDVGGDLAALANALPFVQALADGSGVGRDALQAVSKPPIASKDKARVDEKAQHTR